ncbi:MAG: lipoprotein signal peptidase [Flavobacteriaceae bacterium]
MVTFSFRPLNGFTACILVSVLLLIDQWIKIHIKLNYPLTLYGQDAIIDWGFFKLLFVENKGMAMGTRLDTLFPFLSEYTAKLLLTAFRLIAICGLGYWLWDSLRQKNSSLLPYALCLIFAGALGNIVDSVFYGVWFTDSYGQVATWATGSGYAPLFFGHVVDMFQFPLIEWTWPEWIPRIGGKRYLFFEYIFNAADSWITIGVGILLFFNKKIFTP